MSWRSRQHALPCALALLAPLLGCGPGPGVSRFPDTRVVLSGPILAVDGSPFCRAHPTASILVLAVDSAGRPVERSESHCPSDHFFLAVPPGSYTLQVGPPPDTLTPQTVAAIRVDARQDMELAVRVGAGE